MHLEASAIIEAQNFLLAYKIRNNFRMFLFEKNFRSVILDLGNEFLFNFNFFKFEDFP